jgi:hypothetical protein
VWSRTRLDGAFAVGNTFVLKPKGGPRVNIVAEGVDRGMAAQTEKLLENAANG